MISPSYSGWIAPLTQDRSIQKTSDGFPQKYWGSFYRNFRWGLPKSLDDTLVGFYEVPWVTLDKIVQFQTSRMNWFRNHEGAPGTSDGFLLKPQMSSFKILGVASPWVLEWGPFTYPWMVFSKKARWFLPEALTGYEVILEGFLQETWMDFSRNLGKIP